MLNPLYELLEDSIRNNNPYTDKETLLSQVELFYADGSLNENEYNNLKALFPTEEVI